MAAKVDSPVQAPIAISQAEWEQLSAILKKYLPNRIIWAFGSRATLKNLKRYSDLNLLIDGPPLSLLESDLIEEAFDQSPLPFKVDIVAVASRSKDFFDRIESDKAMLISS